VITTATLPIIVACTITRSPLPAKKSMKPRMTRALGSSTIQSGGRDHTFGTVHAVGTRIFAFLALVEPFAVGRLLGRRARLDGLQRAEQGNPHGLYPSPRVPDSIRGHSSWTTFRA
jgi:hypothetical protein